MLLLAIIKLWQYESSEFGVTLWKGNYTLLDICIFKQINPIPPNTRKSKNNFFCLTVVTHNFSLARKRSWYCGPASSFILMAIKEAWYRPMMEMGLRAKRSRPLIPIYLLRHPADHSRTVYSVLKKKTNTISCSHTHTHTTSVLQLTWQNVFNNITQSVTRTTEKAYGKG